MTTRSNSPVSDGVLHFSEQRLSKSNIGISYSHFCESDNQTTEPKEDSADQASTYVNRQAYLAQLKSDQDSLHAKSHGQFKHLERILECEIAKVTAELARQEAIASPVTVHAKGEKVNLSKLVMVPIDKYPKYNFVGRILGPRGMTVRQLEEDTGCKIMVRGRGSCKVGMRRDRGTDEEPLHVLIQCEDYADVAHEKMDKALKVVHDLLTPPPDGKDELKRKQLIELSIINGTYRPTAATKVALQTPNPASANHLSSPRRTPITPYANRRDLSSNNIDQFFLAGLFAPHTVMNPVDYAKTLLALSMANSSPSFMDMTHASQSSTTQPGVIQQANLHQYLEATAMVNAIPSFTHDGSGDAPKKHL